jgi:3-oxoadipate enol-lactonase
MHWIDLGDTALRYALRAGTGTGTPLVLVHELGGSLNSWDRLLECLDTPRPVLRYDMRGSGMSEKLRDVPFIEDLVDDLLRLLDALGLTEPVTLVGHALGCAVALLLAARHPERVADIVAMSPVTEVAAVRRLSLLAIADQVERSGLRAMVDGALAVSYPADLASDVQLYQQFRCRWMNNDPMSFAWMYRMLADLDIRAELAQVRCPVAILAGTRDALRPPQLSQDVAAQIAGATLLEIDACHFMHVQAAPAVAVALTSFLDAVGVDPVSITSTSQGDPHAVI